MSSIKSATGDNGGKSQHSSRTSQKQNKLDSAAPKSNDQLNKNKRKASEPQIPVAMAASEQEKQNFKEIMQDEQEEDFEGMLADDDDLMAEMDGECFCQVSTLAS